MTGEAFQDHLDLLQFFLSHRPEIVEHIQTVLNAQRQPPHVLQDGALLSGAFEDGFFTVPGITPSLSRLRGRLEAAHSASGFAPRALAGLHNGLIDPTELMIRAFHLWQQTRWPGRNGRVRYAHTLFNLHMVRTLTLVSMRVWDDGGGRASDRLAQVQGMLDQLWRTSPADQPAFVRDARWLIPLAQSPATDDLGAYFTVAATIDDALSEPDRLEIHRAGACMAAGHLRSQIRYYSTRNGVPLDDRSVVVSTRSSNALDYALLIQDLVPLLEAYEQACHTGDAAARLALADAICQGISPDPELFVNRVELLGAYSMIEHLFVTADRDGGAAYSPMGERHVRLVRDYETLVGRLVNALHDDCPRFRPVAGSYSPYGALYGFSTDLIEHMAFKTVQPGAIPPFGLEAVFAAGGADTLAWVSGWRQLPHLTRDMMRQFEYPQPFAEAIFARIEDAFRQRAVNGASGAVQTGRLIAVADEDARAAEARRAESYDESQLLADRREGRTLVSYKAPDGWVAIRKSVLTDVLAAGHDVTFAGLPPAAVGVLQLMCPKLFARSH